MRTYLWCLLIGFAALWLLVLGTLVWITDFYTPDNFTLIEDGLYVGGRVPKPPRGTKAVLNLCEQEDSYRAEVHTWESIRDSAPAPDVDWLRRMVSFIETNRREGRTTFVHCRNGVSRSGLVVVAYEMYKNHWTRAQALEFVRSKRPEVRPNPAFLELLDRWQQELGIAADP
jgi:dual specificity protein phosphatase-like protein